MSEVSVEALAWVKGIVPVVLLVLLWSWESRRPYFPANNRLVHAGRNLATALANTLVLSLLLGSAVAVLSGWTRHQSLGLLNALPEWELLRWPLALFLLDGWMYVWHRANHAIPFLWRFHRVHHADRAMDVTTATRFHLGELVLSVLLKLPLIPLLGLQAGHLLLYETLVLAVTQLHHANVSLGGWDRYLRRVIVTPDLHKVHHSDRQPETDSNYSTVLSVWDRLFGSLREKADCREIVFGLPEYADSRWQTLGGMLKMPFVSSESERSPSLQGEKVHTPPGGGNHQNIARAG